MSELTRMITNLTMAYGLMSKDQFVDAITNFAQTRDMNEDKVKELVEQVFDELALTNKRRKANQAFEATEKERMANAPQDFNAPQSAQYDNHTNSAILGELSLLRKAVENLTSVVGNIKPEENK